MRCREPTPALPKGGRTYLEKVIREFSFDITALSLMHHLNYFIHEIPLRDKR